MKLKHIIIAITVALGGQSFAQQEGHYINMMNNPYMFNPAAAGLTSVMQFEASSRTQWMGYDNGPSSYLFTGHSQIRVKGSEKVLQEYNINNEAFHKAPEYTSGSLKHIIGGSAMTESIGPFSRSYIQGSYAVHMPLTKGMNFGAGLSAGWSNFKILQDRVVLYEDDDPSYTQFLGNTSAQNILNAGAGIVIYNQDWFFGASTQQLLRNSAVFDGVQTESKYNRHYYFALNYGFDLSDQFEIRPSVIAKVSENTPWSMDLGAKFSYNGIWTALQYRTSNAFTVQVGANLIKNIYIAYGYEQGTGLLRTANNGTHEIQIGLYLGNNRNIDRELKQSKKENQE